MGVTNSYKSHAKAKANARRTQQGNRGLLWLLACMVVVATGAALMVPAISMTKESAENEVAAVQVQAEEESQDEAGDAADTPKASDSKASQDEKPAVEDQGEGPSDQGGESVGGGRTPLMKQ